MDPARAARGTTCVAAGLGLKQLPGRFLAHGQQRWHFGLTAPVAKSHVGRPAPWPVRTLPLGSRPRRVTAWVLEGIWMRSRLSEAGFRASHAIPLPHLVPRLPRPYPTSAARGPEHRMTAYEPCSTKTTPKRMARPNSHATSNAASLCRGRHALGLAHGILGGFVAWAGSPGAPGDDLAAYRCHVRLLRRLLPALLARAAPRQDHLFGTFPATAMWRGWLTAARIGHLGPIGSEAQ